MPLRILTAAVMLMHKLTWAIALALALAPTLAQAQFISDTFTDTAATALAAHVGETGTPWVVSPHGPSSAFLVTDANRIRPTITGTGNFYFAAGRPTTPNYYVEATVRQVTTASGFVGVVGRHSFTAQDFYWAVHNQATTDWELLKTVSGTSTKIGQFDQSLSNDTDYVLRLDMRGSQIRVLVDGVERIRVNDLSVSGPGRAGVAGYGTFTNSTGKHLDTVSAHAGAKHNIVCEGDSITQGFGLTAAQSWPVQAANYLGADFATINVATGGHSLTSMITEFAAQVAPLRLSAYGTNTLVIFGGTNDIYFNGSSATVISRIESYAALARAAGYRVVVCTLLPRGDLAISSTLPGDAAAQEVEFEVRRAAVNASIRSNWPTYADAIADLGADQIMGVDGAEDSATYYQDTTHPTALGASILASAIADAIVSASSVQAEPVAVLPSFPPGLARALPTVDASNRIAGIAGTLNTLDALDTAQDAQHGLTLAEATTAAAQSTAANTRVQTGIPPVAPGDPNGLPILNAFHEIKADVWHLEGSAATDSFEGVVQAGMEAQGYSEANAAVLVDWLNGGRLDLILDAKASQASVDAIAVESISLDSGTAQAGSATTLTLASGASSVDDYYNGARVVITSGTGANQERVVHDYVGSTKVATVMPSWITEPDNTSSYVVQPGLTSGFSDTRDLDDVQHVWQLKRSGDGSLRSTNALFISTGLSQTARVGWNCDLPAICPPGSKLASMTLPTSSDSTQGINVVAKLGIEGKIAKVEISVDADAVAGDYWIATQVTNSLGGGPITIYGKVTVQAAP